MAFPFFFEAVTILTIITQEAKQDAKLKSESPCQNPAPRVKRENPDEAEGRQSSKRPKYKTTIDLTEDYDEGEEISFALDDN